MPFLGFNTPHPPPNFPPPPQNGSIVSNAAIDESTCILLRWRGLMQNGYFVAPKNSVVQWLQFFFLFFSGGCPTKNSVQAQKRVSISFFSRVTELRQGWVWRTPKNGLEFSPSAEAGRRPAGGFGSRFRAAAQGAAEPGQGPELGSSGKTRTLRSEDIDQFGASVYWTFGTSLSKHISLFFLFSPFFPVLFGPLRNSLWVKPPRR